MLDISHCELFIFIPLNKVSIFYNKFSLPSSLTPAMLSECSLRCLSINYNFLVIVVISVLLDSDINSSDDICIVICLNLMSNSSINFILNALIFNINLLFIIYRQDSSITVGFPFLRFWLENRQRRVASRYCSDEKCYLIGNKKQFSSIIIT